MMLQHANWMVREMRQADRHPAADSEAVHQTKKLCIQRVEKTHSDIRVVEKADANILKMSAVLMGNIRVLLHIIQITGTCKPNSFGL